MGRGPAGGAQLDDAGDGASVVLDRLPLPATLTSPSVPCNGMTMNGQEQQQPQQPQQSGQLGTRQVNVGASLGAGLALSQSASQQQQSAAAAPVCAEEAVGRAASARCCQSSEVRRCEPPSVRSAASARCYNSSEARRCWSPPAVRSAASARCYRSSEARRCLSPPAARMRATLPLTNFREQSPRLDARVSSHQHCGLTGAQSLLQSQQLAAGAVQLAAGAVRRDSNRMTWPSRSSSPKPQQQRQQQPLTSPWISASTPRNRRSNSPRMQQSSEATGPSAARTPAGSPSSPPSGGKYHSTSLETRLLQGSRTSDCSTLTRQNSLLSSFEAVTSSRPGTSRSGSPRRRCPLSAVPEGRPLWREQHQRSLGEDCSQRSDETLPPLDDPLDHIRCSEDLATVGTNPPEQETSVAISWGSGSGQGSNPMHAIVESGAQDKEDCPVASQETSSQFAPLQLDALRLALAQLEHRLHPDQGSVDFLDLGQLRSSLVLARRGLAALERCEGL